MGIITYSIECNNDETLMEILGVSKKVIKHSGNKTRVVKYLKKNGNAIGMVDEDPESYELDLSTFEFIKTLSSEIDLYQKNNSTLIGNIKTRTRTLDITCGENSKNKCKRIWFTRRSKKI